MSNSLGTGNSEKLILAPSCRSYPWLQRNTSKPHRPKTSDQKTVPFLAGTYTTLTAPSWRKRTLTTMVGAWVERSDRTFSSTDAKPKVQPLLWLAVPAPRPGTGCGGYREPGSTCPPSLTAAVWARSLSASAGGLLNRCDPASHIFTSHYQYVNRGQFCRLACCKVWANLIGIWLI